MRAAAAALWRAVAAAAAAGTLAKSISDGIALAAWALAHPDEFAALVGFARSLGFGADLLASGSSAAVESPAMNRAAGDKPGGR